MENEKSLKLEAAYSDWASVYANWADANEQYVEIRAEADETSRMLGRVGGVCVLIGGASAAIGFAADKIGDAVEQGVSVHYQTEAAVQEVSQALSELGASGAMVFLATGTAFGLAGASMTVAGWFADRTHDKRLATEAYRRQWQREQEDIIDNVFGRDAL